MAPECLQQRPPEAPFGRSNGYRGRGRLQEQGRGSRGSPGTFRGRGPRSHGSFSNSMPPGFGGALLEVLQVAACQVEHCEHVPLLVHSRKAGPGCLTRAICPAASEFRVECNQAACPLWKVGSIVLSDYTGSSISVHLLIAKSNDVLS